MFIRNKKQDELVHMSFCTETAMTLYRVLDSNIAKTKDETERLKLMALRASLNHELWRFNICADTTLAQDK